MNVKFSVFWVTFFLASSLASIVYSWQMYSKCTRSAQWGREIESKTYCLGYTLDNYDCTYVIYVKTGETHTGGTSAKVSLELKDIYLNKVNVTNLASHGVMGKWYDYFESGNLDAFAIKSKCLKGPVCSITLSHDNSGFAPDWYVDSVDVTAISPRRACQKTNFPVGDWLAFDKAPFSTRRGIYLCDEIVHFGSKCSYEN